MSQCCTMMFLMLVLLQAFLTTPHSKIRKGDTLKQCTGEWPTSQTHLAWWKSPHWPRHCAHHLSRWTGYIIWYCEVNQTWHSPEHGGVYHRRGRVFLKLRSGSIHAAVVQIGLVRINDLGFSTETRTVSDWNQHTSQCTVQQKWSGTTSMSCPKPRLIRHVLQFYFSSRFDRVHVNFLNRIIT